MPSDSICGGGEAGISSSRAGAVTRDSAIMAIVPFVVISIDIPSHRHRSQGAKEAKKKKQVWGKERATNAVIKGGDAAYEMTGE